MKFIIDGDGEIIFSGSLEDSLPIVKNCLERIGSIKEVKSDAIVGWIRFGFQKVKTIISWRSEGLTTRFVIQCFSDEIWNLGGRNARKRLIELIRNNSNSGYYVDRLGVHPSVMFIFGIIFILVVGFVVIKLFQ